MYGSINVHSVQVKYWCLSVTLTAVSCPVLSRWLLWTSAVRRQSRHSWESTSSLSKPLVSLPPVTEPHTSQQHRHRQHTILLMYQTSHKRSASPARSTTHQATVNFIRPTFYMRQAKNTKWLFSCHRYINIHKTPCSSYLCFRVCALCGATSKPSAGPWALHCGGETILVGMGCWLQRAN